MNPETKEPTSDNDILDSSSHGTVSLLLTDTLVAGMRPASTTVVDPHDFGSLQLISSITFCNALVPTGTQIAACTQWNNAATPIDDLSLCMRQCRSHRVSFWGPGIGLVCREYDWASLGQVMPYAMYMFLMPKVFSRSPMTFEGTSEPAGSPTLSEVIARGYLF
jgi:hypothetical protein